MKRAKIMLVAIAIMATVGGLFAFKASQKFSDDYCVRSITDNSTTFCTSTILGFKTLENESTPQFTYYYTLKQVDNCQQASCPTTKSTTFVEEP